MVTDYGNNRGIHSRTGSKSVCVFEEAESVCVAAARQLKSLTMRCIGCQAEFAQIDGPTHEYVLSSPGCWAAYGEVLAREYSDYRPTRLHRLTVDTYAVQHPGVNVPAARRSVGLHLSRLYLLLEAGWSTNGVRVCEAGSLPQSNNQ